MENKKYKLIALYILIGFIAACTSIEKDKNYKPPEPKLGDGYIEEARLFHDPLEDFFYTKENFFRIRMKARANDVESIKCVIENLKKEYKMQKIGSDGFLDHYIVEEKINLENVKYYFEIKDGQSIYYMGKNSDSKKEKIKNYEKNLEKVEENLEKSRLNGIAYQIFIDRFYNGNTKNDPQFNEFGPKYFKVPDTKELYLDQSAWNNDDEDEDIPSFEISRWDSNWHESEDWEENLRKKVKWNIKHTRHYGGDFDGIISKLEYLKKLGIEAIWTNPILYSYSNHKYNIIDFRHISPDYAKTIQTGDIAEKYENASFKYKSLKGESEYKLLNYDIKSGENALGETANEKTWIWTESDIEFLEFTSKLHENEMKIIVDMPINYVSKRFWAFQDAIMNGPNSEYSDWFVFRDWQKTKQYTGENVDIWNPGIKYNGDAIHGTYMKDGEKLRRKWIVVPQNESQEIQEEIYMWNIENTDFEKWQGHSELPLLNHKNERLQNHIVSSMKKWVIGLNEIENSGIDGIRFDYVENNLDEKFIMKLSSELKKINENIIIVGDAWRNTVELNHKYKFTNNTSYELNKNFMEYLINTDKDRKKTAKELKDSQMLYYYKLPKYTIENLFNFIGSYNTDRVFSNIINPNLDFDKQNSIFENKDYFAIRPDLYDTKAVDNFKRAILYQMTNIGIPVIYYGDEKGMWGSDAPNSMKPMLWDMEMDNETDNIQKYREKIESFGEEVVIDEANNLLSYKVAENEDINTWYNTLIDIRNKNRDLFVKGKIKYIDVKDDDCIVYERSYDNKEVIVVMNQLDKERDIEIKKDGENGSYIDLLSEREDKYDIINDVIKIKLEGKKNYLLHKK